MRELGPEGVPATARVLAAASVCITADSVFVCVFIELPVIGAFDGFAIHIGIAAAAAAGIGHCLWRASAVGMLGHCRGFCSAATGSIGLYELRFRIVIQCIGRYKPRHSTFTSHKKIPPFSAQIFLLPAPRVRQVGQIKMSAFYCMIRKIFWFGKEHVHASRYDIFFKVVLL